MATGVAAKGRAGTVQTGKFRTDIQGLRAIAVGLVLLYHSNSAVLRGGFVGVDVFFVISGFLITSHLLARLEQTGTLDLGAFFAKRARRILPASFVVWGFSILVGLAVLPPLQVPQLLRGAIATILYVPNIFFAAVGTDYLADPTPSLFQHYWSLGVEEQFYLVWPLFLLAGFTLFKRSRRSLFWLIAALVLVSFTLCVVVSFRSQPWAFFSLPTRAWELGVGGLVAFLAQERRRSSWVMPAIAWIGLIGILASAVVFSHAITFPGYAAALPVIFTAAAIYGGSADSPASPGRILSLAGFQFVGKISYSLYLVHWPLLIIPTQASGTGEEISTFLSYALIVAAVPLAYLLYRFVELPCMALRISGRRTSAAVGVASATGLILCGALLATIATSPIHSAKRAVPVVPNANPIFTAFVPMNLSPTLRDAEGDSPSIYADGCHVGVITMKPSGCRYGENTEAPTIALFGDSHAAQWFPALKVLADEGTIQLRVDTKSSCPSVNVIKVVQGGRYVACETWRANVIEQLNRERPDGVILSNFGGSDGLTDVSASEWGAGLSATINSLNEVGHVIVVADTPRLSFQPTLCLSAHLENAGRCSEERTIATDEALNAIEESAAESEKAGFVDMTKYICSVTDCGQVIGNVLVYRDSNHITATFSRLLGSPLRDELGAELEFSAR